MDFNALTAASHTTLIAILGLLIWRLAFVYDEHLGARVMQAGLLVSAAIAVVALMIERSYYLAARLLASGSTNLWELHPAPEVLSLMVACAFYGVHVPILIGYLGRTRAATTRITLECIGFAMLWLGVAWVAA